MADLSLTDLIGQDTLDFLVQRSKATQTQVENAKKAEALSGQAEKIYNDVADASRVVSAADSARKAEVTKRVAQAANAAGLSPAADMDTVYGLITKINFGYQEVANNLKEVRAKNEMPIWENPLQWIANQITLPISEAKLEGSARELELSTNQLSRVNNALSQAGQIAIKTTESISAAESEALATIASGEAQIRARQAALEGLKYNSEQINAVVNGSKDQLDALYNIQTAQQRSEQFALAVKNYQLEVDKFNIHRAEKEESERAKAEGKQVDASFAETIALGDAVMGMPPRQGFELKSAVQLLKSGQSKELMQIYEIGRRYRATGIPMIGASPAEAIRHLEELPNNIAPARSEVLALLKQAKEQVMRDPKIDKKDQKAIDGEINKLVGQTIGGQMASITAGSGNVFDIGDLSSYLGGAPGMESFAGIADLKNLPLSQKVFIPAIAAGQPLSDPKMVLGLTAKAIQNGDITSTQAVDNLTFLYRKANLINQSALNLKGLGIALPADGMTYNARLGAFAGSIDMTNPAQVAQYFAKDLAERAKNAVTGSANYRMGIKPQGTIAPFQYKDQ